MVKYIKTPFANTGDKAAIPNAIQPSGDVSFEQGYSVNYSQNPLIAPTAKQIERVKMNELFFEITEAIQQYQQHSHPDFITTTDNGGIPYPYSKYDTVRYFDGVNTKVYQSKIDSNVDLPTVTASWGVHALGTPLLASNNFSDLGALFLALTNLGFASSMSGGQTTFTVPNAPDPSKPWIIKMGSISNAGSPTGLNSHVTFALAFPNNPPFILVTPYISTLGVGNLSGALNTNTPPTTTGFDWYNATTGGLSNNWLAISQ
jgi:hypothetical protein